MNQDLQNKKKVLIVDSDLEAAVRWLAVCDSVGFEGKVEGVVNRVVDRVLEWRPDVIALDLNTPCVESQHLLQNLQRHPDTRFIPILILSADELKETLQGAESSFLLHKPQTLEKVIEGLQHLNSLQRN